jgi:hypothetical protein
VKYPPPTSMHSARGGFDDLDILDANNQCAHLNYAIAWPTGWGCYRGDARRRPRSSALPADCAESLGIAQRQVGACGCRPRRCRRRLRCCVGSARCSRRLLGGKWSIAQRASVSSSGSMTHLRFGAFLRTRPCGRRGASTARRHSLAGEVARPARARAHAPLLQSVAAWTLMSGAERVVLIKALSGGGT